MKLLKLLELRLKNWKQFKDYTFTPNGNNAAIYGQNGAGKTVGHYDAILWLLLGIDSQNRSDYKIKTEDENGDPAHHLDHSVEAVLLVGDSELTLKKVYKEKWTAKRSSINAEFDGHETLHYVDTVPVGKREYDAVISGICDRETFKLLTNPHHFMSELKKDARRKMVFDTFGDMTDDEIIASTDDLARLPELLDGKTIEQRKKVIKESQANINKRKIEIPAEITGAESVLPDVTGLVENDLRGQLVMLRGKQKNKNRELARLEAGGEGADKTTKLRTLEAEVLELKNDQKERESDGQDLDIKAHSEALSAATTKVTEFSTVNTETNASVKTLNKEIARLEEEAETLRGEFDQAEDEAFAMKEEPVCPACGQDIPKEDLKAIANKALEEFNKKKAEKLEGIRDRGKELVVEINKNQATIKGYEETLKENKKAWDTAIAKVEAIEKAKAEPAPKVDVPVDPEIEKLNLGIEDLKNEIATIEQDGRSALAVKEQEVKSIDSTIEKHKKDFDKFDQRLKGEVRIEELKTEEKALAGQFEEFQADLFLIEQFVKTKVELLTDKINSEFELARFKLFEVQVNGAINPICEVTYLWSPPSAGQTVQIGMDIIRAFSKKLGIVPMIFVDNAESVTRIIDMPGQVIQLIHSLEDKKLRVVQELEKIKEAV